MILPGIKSLSTCPARILPIGTNGLAPLLLVASPYAGGASAFPSYCRTWEIRSGTGILSPQNTAIHSRTVAAWEIVGTVMAPNTRGARGRARGSVIGLIDRRSLGLAGVSLRSGRGIRNIRLDCTRRAKAKADRRQCQDEQNAEPQPSHSSDILHCCGISGWNEPGKRHRCFGESASVGASSFSCTRAPF